MRWRRYRRVRGYGAVIYLTDNIRKNGIAIPFEPLWRGTTDCERICDCADGQFAATDPDQMQQGRVPFDDGYG